jgi:hypothetical protein
MTGWPRRCQTELLALIPLDQRRCAELWRSTAATRGNGGGTELVQHWRTTTLPFIPSSFRTKSAGQSGSLNSVWVRTTQILRRTWENVVDPARLCAHGGTFFHLCPGGYYIVEDIMTSVIPAWREALTTSYIPKWPNHEFTLARLPNMFNYFDNSILIIHNKV